MLMIQDDSFAEGFAVFDKAELINAGGLAGDIERGQVWGFFGKLNGYQASVDVV